MLLKLTMAVISSDTSHLLSSTTIYHTLYQSEFHYQNMHQLPQRVFAMGANKQSFGASASIRISQPPINQDEMPDGGEGSVDGLGPKQCDDCLKCQF